MLCGHAFGVQLGLGWTVWPWLVRHARGFCRDFKCLLLDRAYQACLVEVWLGQDAPFAEVVLFREAVSHTRMLEHRHQREADPRRRSSIFLGIAERTNEFSVGDKTGTCLTRIVRRHPVSSEAAGTLRGREAWQTETTRSSAWENLGHNVKTCQMHQRDLGRSRSR